MCSGLCLKSSLHLLVQLPRQDFSAEVTLHLGPYRSLYEDYYFYNKFYSRGGLNGVFFGDRKLELCKIG